MGFRFVSNRAVTTLIDAVRLCCSRRFDAAAGALRFSPLLVLHAFLDFFSPLRVWVCRWVDGPTDQQTDGQDERSCACRKVAMLASLLGTMLGSNTSL